MTKIFKSLALVAAAVASLVSCQEVSPVEPIEKEYTYTFSLSNPDTKAYLDLNDAVTKWESGDRLGVYTVGTAGTSYNRDANIDVNETLVVFQISSIYALNTGHNICGEDNPYTGNKTGITNINPGSVFAHSNIGFDRKKLVQAVFLQADSSSNCSYTFNPGKLIYGERMGNGVFRIC